MTLEGSNGMVINVASRLPLTTSFLQPLFEYVILNTVLLTFLS